MRIATNPGAPGLVSESWVSTAQRYCLLLLITAISILCNGYHYATEDAGIYLPDIIQRLHPSHYPRDAEFIHAQSSVSIYAPIASSLAWVLGGSVEASVFLLHCVGVFILLAAAFSLAEQLFSSRAAAWSAVCVLAGATSIYAAGTSIPIMDPYFTARTLSTPLTLLALANSLRQKWLLALAALALAAAIHPLMALFAGILISCHSLIEFRVRTRTPIFATHSIPVEFGPLNAQARETMTMAGRTFFFAARWDLADWIGVIAPLTILIFLWRMPIAGTTPLLRRLCGAASLCAIAATLFFLAISFTPSLEALVRLQPMRVFQLIYIVMFVIVGGLLGQSILRAHAFRWTLLLLALGAIDFGISRNAYPASAHIERPRARSGDAWVQAFEWAKQHTPEDALFALPPQYIYADGEDRHGFRAIAERSSLADQLKDGSVAAIFPSLASEWKRQVDAQAGWDNFTPLDFHRLAERYPITWVIVRLPQSRGLDCPYRNSNVAVCQIQ